MSFFAPARPQPSSSSTSTSPFLPSPSRALSPVLIPSLYTTDRALTSPPLPISFRHPLHASTPPKPIPIPGSNDTSPVRSRPTRIPSIFRRRSSSTTIDFLARFPLTRHRQSSEILRHGKHAQTASPGTQPTDGKSSKSTKSSQPISPQKSRHNDDAQRLAAHHAQTAQQQQQQQQQSRVPAASPKYREEAEKIVADERAQSDKMPQYPGLEEYRLVEKMGDGAFSNVYKAVDRKSGIKVAVKVVRKYELNQSQRANILKEVQIMRGIDHPGVVRLLKFFESDEHYFLVLELMEGGELFHQIVKLTYFSEALSRHVIVQVAEAIRYLHEERGVVHRDIKPENLLFERIPIIPSKNPIHRPYDEEKEDEGEFQPGIGGGEIGRVKIADFGLSKIVWDEQTMTPCGTVGYTAPEIVKDERYSKSVDMWALGCVLYTLLCGFPPFYDESINVLTEKVARGYYTFLSPWWDDISHSAKDLISHLLCVDPAQRYTIDEFLAHPWIKEAQPPPLPSARLNVPSNAPMDSPLLASIRAGNREGRSPGVGALKEAFDITYAVHRMEEEGARRRAYNGPGGAGTRGFLHGLNEEEEEGDEAVQVEEARRKHGEVVARQIQEHRGRAAANAASGVKEQPAPAQQYVGRGGANRREAEAALYDGRAGQRDRAGGKSQAGGGFELDLGNATLLGRRGNKKVAPSPLAQMNQ
ncbi:hypothetical protein B9479_002308 [Cryptococcus floricola]|uniref:Protein kinase domain-containing protein n=1 Tax=Cryptococcus floricola TaxID=2591691 RepID=A0A5D3B384_9TREE|nr:hypothetical protein B9479_002308 [Cryptococcus floricola]